MTIDNIRGLTFLDRHLLVNFLNDPTCHNCDAIIRDGLSNELVDAIDKLVGILLNESE